MTIVTASEAELEQAGVIGTVWVYSSQILAPDLTLVGRGLFFECGPSKKSGPRFSQERVGDLGPLLIA